MKCLLCFVLLVAVCVSGEDPTPVSYPGQVNVGLLADMRSGGVLGSGAAHRAMAAVWAAAQENFAHPQQLNIGVYIFDTCGQTDVAERQVYRLLGHVVPDKKASAPPLFAVVTDGPAADFAAAPGRLLDAFSVPVVSASAMPAPGQHHLISTATDTATLATAAVSVLQRLGLLEVAVMAEEVEGGGIFAEFSRQAARVSGMQVEGGGGGGSGGVKAEVEDSFAALRHISQPGKSPLKAVVFLVSAAEAERLLTEVEEDTSALPWLVVTPTHVTPPPQTKRARQVLLLSPESGDSREFDAYFQQLLDEDTARYHPLLQEYLLLNSTTDDNDTHRDSRQSADVSSVVRAVRLLSSALRRVQSRDCPRAADCLLRLPPAEMGSRVADALRQDDGQGALRYVLREIKDGGDVTEVGFYSVEGGLQLYDDLLQHFLPPPPASSVVDDNSRWKIFDDDILLPPFTTTSATQTEGGFPDDFLLLQDDFHLQSLSEGNSSSSSSASLPASNLRSVSLSSHHENDEPLPKEESDQSVFRHQPLSAWLGRRPWALGVLGASALLSLAALYSLVFLLVRGCEGGGPPLLLPALQMASLLVLCVGAGLHAWSPSPLLCALRGALTNCALAFCYGGLLLRGMHLRAVGILGLGGRVSRLNQLLTLALCVGGQVALEAQRWPADCSDPKRQALQSGIFSGILLVTAVAVAAAANRRGGMSVPFGRRESRALLCSSLFCLLLLGAWSVSRLLLPDTGPPLSIARSALLLGTALAVLVGLALGTPRRHKRPLSYADSLSTVFTLFSKEEGGGSRGGSTTGRGRTKTLEKTTPSYGENLLYSDYQSAYP